MNFIGSEIPVEWRSLCEMGEQILFEMAALEREKGELPEDSPRVIEIEEELARLKSELLETAPADRYEWQEGKPIKDLWKEKIMTHENKEEAIKRKAEEMRSVLDERFLPELQSMLKKRTEAKREYKRVSGLEKSYQERILSIKEEIKSLRNEVNQALSKGTDPARILSVIREREDSVGALESWLKDFDGKRVAQEELSAAEKELAQAVDMKIISIMTEFQATVDTMASQLFIFLRAWDAATSSFQNSIESQLPSNRALLIHEPHLRFSMQ